MLRERLGPTIDKALTPNACTNIMKGIAKFIDKNSNILMTLNLSERYSFADTDRDLIYDNINVTKEQMTQEVNNAKAIPKNNKIKSNPFYCACILTMCSLFKQKKEKEAHQIMMYMSLNMYTSLHRGFYEYGNNPKIMAYTIAHLDNSFIIRQMASLLQWLDNNASTTLNTYKQRIIRCEDDDITWVINALWDRLKGKLRKISNAYYDNWKSGNYLNEDEDSYSENDYHEMDNNSFAINRLTTRVYIKLINHQFDERFFKYAITRSDTSLQKLKNLINDVIDADEGILKKYLSSNIEYYLIMSGNSFDYISRGEYISYMKAAYASNSDNQQMIFIKKTLDDWLDENMVAVGRQNYGKTARLGYKKSLYMFFTFIINQEAKFR